MPNMTKDNNNFDENFRKRRENQRKNLASSNKKEGEENENKILYEVAISGPEGISQKQLAYNIDLNEETVRLHAIDLMEKGLITKKGKQDNYILTDYAANDPKLQSMIFGMDATRELVNGISSLFIENSILTNLSFAVAIQEQLFFSKLKEGKTLTKETEGLLDFAIKIGSLITFIMLKAVKPSENEETNGRKKVEQSLTWVRNSILPSVILSEFMEIDIVKKGKRIKKSRQSRITKNMNPKTPWFMKEEFQSRVIPDELFSPYEIDKKTYQSLESAFNQIWPFTNVILKGLSKHQRLVEKGKEGISSIHKTTKAMSEIKEDKEEENNNLLCFKSQQMVKIMAYYYLERLKYIDTTS
jgi:hypothetical protein